MGYKAKAKKVQKDRERKKKDSRGGGGSWEGLTAPTRLPTSPAVCSQAITSKDFKRCIWEELRGTSKFLVLSTSFTMEKNLLQQHAIIQNFGFTSRGVHMHKKNRLYMHKKRANFFPCLLRLPWSLVLWLWLPEAPKNCMHWSTFW